MIPLWTARLTADDVPSFTAHRGLAPARPPVKFSLKQEQKITPPMPRKRQEEKYHSISYVQTRNKEHDARLGKPLTNKMLDGPTGPARSTRTATSKNMHK